ncbi:GntR family transcriptional regulator [Sinirhodobacter populi]|uniref:GntR family transcriptional regulator n=1 Tax=Paenirhodobacter populi TaxID=2306993 RepID=A0A443KLW2_9RHOB|nr:GntR family transcriptional regulator [Sinirhodobacter populi]RWR33818.1 GntR family transcriptional regulator [Sinirhodobacter populi]
MPSLQRQTLHRAIVEQLRDMIVNGTLEPGQKIPERELCEQFGISRTPFREALKVLATEGVIELLPQRGARVSVLTDAEIQDLFPIIAALEALAGELACGSITDAEIMRIGALHRDMMEAYQRRDHIQYSRCNHAIHITIFEATRNAELLSLYRTLELRIRNIRHTVRQQAPDWALAVSDHEAMLEAICDRDGARLAQIMRRHVLNTATAVRNSVGAMDGISANPDPENTAKIDH